MSTSSTGLSTQVGTQVTAQASQTLAEVLDRLSQFDGPPEQFLMRLLEVQCRAAPAEHGAILGLDAQKRPKPLVMFPPPASTDSPQPAWLALAIEASPRVMQSGKTQLAPYRPASDFYGDGHSHQIMMIPLRGASGMRGVAAYVLPARDPAQLARGRERLELTVSLLSLYEMRLNLQARRMDLQRLRQAMEVLAAINEHDRMRAAAMALCNEIATRYAADRVALGWLKGRYVELRAISSTEQFNRKMKLVQDIEAAMEECVDQDVEVLYPSAPGATYVNRAAGDLCTRQGPTSVGIIPLRRHGQVVATLSVERSPQRPLTPDEVESLRLTCDLCTARLMDQQEHDRWIGAKLASQARKFAALLVGSKHTGAKVAAVLVLVALVSSLTVKGPDRVDASFEIQAIDRRFIPSPFDGHILKVHVEPGDRVKAGDLLLELDIAEKLLELASQQAEKARYQKESDLAMRDGKTAEMQIAEANIRKAEAQIRLLKYQVDHARIVSPIDGTIASGDLKRKIGAPTQTGEVLFEVAPLESLRAELQVPEKRVADLFDSSQSKASAGKHRGSMASLAKPGDYMDFEIERINPVAEVVENENVFKVRVKLLEHPQWLHPGMKGVAKVTVGQRPYAELWTRDVINWVRMKLWL